ncbi:related to ECM22-strong similarity to YDR213w, weak similarity to Lys14p [Fusarium oxysporum]|uniref:Related to ECM22-strong similarity to YDR213w, weak similarity to Lys14p n=1 Tax=Fusarium oxysporum TaxID=5507 RepID=A0A2H3TA97_FUSOX|nr:related to ECM22-strong similarity to YDR213w, weak similarity to Lys14p [Fusarium oxysporum]
MANDTQTPKGYAPFDLYPYNPSQGPAYAFLGLFGAAGIAHFIMMFPYRAAFPIPMIIGCGMEAAAYWFRSRSHDNLRQTLPFLIQNLLVLVAPPFLAATIYMSLGRITRALKAQEASLISLRWITKLFVLVDLICFATQTAGAIMSGSEDLEEAKRGQTIIIGGLVLQILAFALFIICTLTLQIRLRSHPPVQCVAGVVTHYRRYFIALYCTSGLFLVRNLCDEVKPQCGKCVQFGVWCDYSPQPPGPQVSLNHQPDSQSRRPGRPRSDWTSWAEQIRSHAAESVAESPGHLNTMDLELFHSYMTRTASTLGDGSSLSLLWSEGAPRVGFQHNCILKLILSLSSYHLARLKPIDKQRYSLIAETHLTAALQPAMMLISNLGGDNSPAAYLTSTLICFVALAKGPSPGNLLLTNIEGQVSWLHLLRGVRLVVESAGWSSIFSGMLAEYAPIPSGDTPEHNAMTDPTLMVEDIEDWRSSLNGISHLIAQLAEEKLGNVYDRELQALTACFESTFRKGQDAALYTVGKLQDVIGWVYRLGDDYMEGLRQRDLISTVMLGHFCVLLRTVEAQFWFMHEWAAHIIGEILVISPNSRQWLSWPIAYVNPEQ